MSARNLKASRLGASSLLPGDAERDPMESLANLMDVMLVFACGLLLALVANWNIDLAAGTSPGNPSVEELDGELAEVAEGIALDDGTYAELGTVYRDEETGQLYVVSSAASQTAE